MWRVLWSECNDLCDPWHVSRAPDAVTTNNTNIWPLAPLLDTDINNAPGDKAEQTILHFYQCPQNINKQSSVCQ